MTKKKTLQTMDKAPALTKLKTGACSMSRMCLSPPEELQGRCRLHKNAVAQSPEERLRDKDKRRAVYHRAKKGRSFRRDL